MDRAALLVVDVQKGMFTQADAEIWEGSALLSRLGELLDRARAEGVPVVYTRFDGPPGTPLEAETPGASIHSALNPGPSDSVVGKEDSDAFLGTDLHDVLSSLGTRTLVVCGLQSEFCVDSTCRTAYSLGYSVVLVQNGHSTTDSKTLQAAQIIEHENETLSRAYASLRPAETLWRQSS